MSQPGNHTKHPQAAEPSATPPGYAPHGWAIRSAPAVIAFALITVLGLAADLWSKHAVFHWLLSDPGIERMAQPLADRVTPDQAIRNHLPIEQEVLGKIRFRISTNPGVVFGWSMPPLLVNIVSIITVGLVFLFFAVGDRRAWSMHIGLACIMAGALGNLYDRLFGAVYIPGFSEPITNQVRDFIDLSGYEIAGYSYRYVFNVADVLLVIGVGLLIVNWWIFRKQEKQVASRKTQAEKA